MERTLQSQKYIQGTIKGEKLYPTLLNTTQDTGYSKRFMYWNTGFQQPCEFSGRSRLISQRRKPRYREGVCAPVTLRTASSLCCVSGNSGPMQTAWLSNQEEKIHFLTPCPHLHRNGKAAEGTGRATRDSFSNPRSRSRVPGWSIRRSRF